MPGNSLQLDDHRVSGQHAVIQWTGSQWEVRDLGSRNGTFVNDQRVSPGEPVALGAGDRVHFGVEELAWNAEDVGPPGVLAQRLDADEVRTAREGMLALPDEAAPRAIAYARGSQWLLEVDGDARVISNGEVIVVDGVSWRFVLPEAVVGTQAVDQGPSLETVTMRFAVSRDEEHVQITFVHRGAEVVLEAREHGYTLLTLARARLEDQALPLAEQGWIDRDRLLRMLGVDTNSLNVAIYRARGQLASAGLGGATGIVEVRRGARRLGLEPSRLEIVPL